MSDAQTQRHAARDARRVGRIAAGVELVAVAEAVAVAVDADAHARARRHAGVGQLLAGGVGERPQRRVADRRLGGAVGHELAAADVEAPRSSPPTAPFTTRSHSPASARWHESVDARVDDAGVACRCA